MKKETKISAYALESYGFAFAQTREIFWNTKQASLFRSRLQDWKKHKIIYIEILLQAKKKKR